MTAGRPVHGFTLIELLVVLAVMAMLVSLVAPRYLERVDSAREAVLRHNLHGLRTAIDQFYRDKARYPASLDELAAQRYVRAVPVDPITGSAKSWVMVPPPVGAGVFDIKSGANGHAGDGSNYASW